MPHIHTVHYASVSNSHGRPRSSLPLDIHVPTASASQRFHGRKETPVVLWFHGGGCVQGTRTGMAQHMRDAVDKLGVVVVAPDYRLCPQVKLLSGVLPDCLAASQWISSHLSTFLSQSASYLPPPSPRPLLCGSSVGGFLALLLSLPLSLPDLPSPIVQARAVAGIYPITDMGAPFFMEEQTPFMGRLTPEEEWSQKLESYLEETSEVMSSTEGGPSNDRNKLYMWAQQNALFPSLLFSSPTPTPSSDDVLGTRLPSRITSFSPAEASAIPPIYVVHGTKDAAVHVDQATELVEALKQREREVVYEERAGLDHLFDLFDEEERMEDMWRWVAGQFGIAYE